jgi:hypothetical protein
MCKSKAQSAASATANNIHSIRAFARCADGDRPTIKSPRKPNHVVLQLIRRAPPKSMAFAWAARGGGASLEYLEGKALPGVDVLNRGVPSRSGA